MKYLQFYKSINVKTRQKIVFWLTFILLMLFAVTPRGYAQELPAGTTTDVGTTTEVETTVPVISPEMQEAPPPPAVVEEIAPTTFPYTKKFIITSYYSPLPNQSRYITGSYEGDIRLNGSGVHGADGTDVYPGMAAAPKTIPFGTKMLIPGFGTVAIHDRGGAIKNSRLDVWAGHGEEGLRRALAWGMRTVDVTVYGINSNIQESVNFVSMPLIDISSVPKQTKYIKSDIGLSDSGEAVKELQRFLILLGYYDGGGKDIPGYFGSETEAAVQAFQLAEKVINSTDDTGAGNFGPRSRYALETALDKREVEMLGKLPPPTLGKGDKGQNVGNLQYILQEYGFLADGTTTAQFDDVTFSALIRFQTDAGIVKNGSDSGAGFYGPKTKGTLENLIKDTFNPSTSLIAPSRDSDQPDENVFGKELLLNSKGSDVVILQEELRRLNFLGLKPTGHFGKTTEHAVFKFQQAFGIIANEKDVGAGVVGPKTQEKFNELISLRTRQKKLIGDTTEKKELVSQRMNDESMLVAGVVQPEMFETDLFFGSRGADVEKLQKILKRLGFFQGRLTTSYFGDITKKSLIAFQQSHGLTESGDFNADTRKILNRIISAPQS